MCKIFIDFDGVLVDTPKYIKEEIQLKGNYDNTFINIRWNELLEKCEYVNAEKNLLIDDKINIDNWNDKGGIGVLFRENMSLQNILKEYVELK